MNEAYPDTSLLSPDECCICGCNEVVMTDPFGYAFCQRHDHRSEFLKRGRAHNWPGLLIDGITGSYTISEGVEAWLLTMICGTDERVIELLDALDECEHSKAVYRAYIERWQERLDALHAMRKSA